MILLPHEFELEKDGTTEYDTVRKDGYRIRFKKSEKKEDTLGKSRTVLRVDLSIEVNDEIAEEYQDLIDKPNEGLVKIILAESDQRSIDEYD